MNVNTSLQNNSTVSEGNPDFSIDNVATNAPIPEPVTCALMHAGRGAIGFVARRRRA